MHCPSCGQVAQPNRTLGDGDTYSCARCEFAFHRCVDGRVARGYGKEWCPSCRRQGTSRKCPHCQGDALEGVWLYDGGSLKCSRCARPFHRCADGITRRDTCGPLSCPHCLRCSPAAPSKAGERSRDETRGSCPYCAGKEIPGLSANDGGSVQCSRCNRLFHTCRDGVVRRDVPGPSSCHHCFAAPEGSGGARPLEPMMLTSDTWDGTFQPMMRGRAPIISPIEPESPSLGALYPLPRAPSRSSVTDPTADRITTGPPMTYSGASAHSGGKTQVRLGIVSGELSDVRADALIVPRSHWAEGVTAFETEVNAEAGQEMVRELGGLVWGPGGLDRGRTLVTSGHRLAVKHIIHVTGPNSDEGSNPNLALLVQCYSECLNRARRLGARTVVLSPSIVCGRRGYDVGLCAEIAVSMAKQWARDNAGAVDAILFYTPDQASRDAYSKRLTQ